MYSGHPVYYGHRATFQNFQLPYIFCKADLYIAVTLYITVPGQISQVFQLPYILCKVHNGHLGISQRLYTGLTVVEYIVFFNMRVKAISFSFSPASLPHKKASAEERDRDLALCLKVSNLPKN